MDSNTHILSLLVSNKSGVLNRVAGLFSKRGYNIESLSVASTENNTLSRMTTVVRCDQMTLEQIIKQISKLFDVKHVALLPRENAVMRELLLIKIRVTPAQRPEVEATIRSFKAKSIDLSQTSQIIEMTGESNKMDSFIEILKPYGIIEMARTGLTSLERGGKSINDELTNYEEKI